MPLSEGYMKIWQERIIEMTSTKAWGLEKICAKLTKMEFGSSAPTSRTVRNWIAADAEFRAAWLEAKSAQAELLADQVVEIADTPKMGIKTEKTRIGWVCPKCDLPVKWIGDGFFHGTNKSSPACSKPDPVYEDKIIQADMTEHRNLQMRARMWKAAKLGPKKWGDRLQLANDEENPVGNTLAQLLTLEELTAMKRRMKAGETKKEDTEPT